MDGINVNQGQVSFNHFTNTLSAYTSHYGNLFSSLFFWRGKTSFPKFFFIKNNEYGILLTKSLLNKDCNFPCSMKGKITKCLNFEWWH
jgi:hypothetical protein